METGSSSFRFLLIGEDEMHWQTVSQWTDTQLRHVKPELRDHEDLGFFREWVAGREARVAGRPYVKDSDVRRARIPVHGDMGATPFVSDQRAAVARLLYATLADASPEVVFLCRDTDDDAERREGARRAAAARRWPFRVVLAIAQPEMEAWRIAVGQPEHDAYSKLKAELPIDPIQFAHLLSSSPESKKDAKRVLGELGIEDTWKEATVDAMQSTPDELGLAEFVATSDTALRGL